MNENNLQSQGNIYREDFLSFAILTLLFCKYVVNICNQSFKTSVDPYRIFAVLPFQDFFLLVIV